VLQAIGKSLQAFLVFFIDEPTHESVQ
jgi:hypothetical protein